MVGPTDAEQVHTSPVSLVTFVAKGELTGGRFGLFRYDMLPGRGGPGPHLHTTFSESFYVMSGVLTVHDGKGWVQAGAGSFLHVPERSVHGFRNDSDDAGRKLSEEDGPSSTAGTISTWWASGAPDQPSMTA